MAAVGLNLQGDNPLLVGRVDLNLRSIDVSLTGMATTSPAVASGAATVAGLPSITITGEAMAPPASAAGAATVAVPPERTLTGEAVSSPAVASGMATVAVPPTVILTGDACTAPTSAAGEVSVTTPSSIAIVGTAASPPAVASGTIGDPVWLNVAVEEIFIELWPPNEDDPDSPVVGVTAPSYPRITFDLAGIRGAFAWNTGLFAPSISFIHHTRYVAHPIANYLTAFEADPASNKEIDYYLIYANGQQKTVTVRVWQDANYGRDWIVERIAYEDARDALWAQGLPATDLEEPVCQP